MRVVYFGGATRIGIRMLAYIPYKRSPDEDTRETVCLRGSLLVGAVFAAVFDNYDGR
jgi:hypothetical protein